MWISQLQLTNFRNYARLQLQPDAGLCVLTGDNAAGKTNVLESVFLCALGRSHRTSRDAELIREAQQFGVVQLTLHTRGGTRSITCKLAPGERKRLLIDGASLSRSGELLGCLNVVMFAPEDLMLVKGGPAERRRFLDMEISQLKPAYYYTLQQYNAALKQRNALLKEEASVSAGLLEPWDEQLSRLGAAITIERAAFLDELSAIAANVHLKLSGGRETLLLSYQPNLPGVEPERLAATMRERLFENTERDVYRGSTSVGPHRDDVMMVLDGSDVRVYGSQGQQRTVVLSLKLSELEIIKRLRGETPVLLLDDVFSELDKRRQRMLLEAVQGCQTFITCTHLEELTAAGALQMQVYSVSNGNVIEV
ncbi:MAG: DNA replication/repair protein RecF [bacterium]|nr:DNA replication/repair protein RecF [bacterium]